MLTKVSYFLIIILILCKNHLGAEAATNEEMFRAVRKNDINALQSYLKEGDSPNVTLGNTGFTLLMVAAKDGKIDIIKLLLSFGAKIDLTEPSGKTALMIAAEYSQADAVQILIGHGANVNHRSDFGANALFLANGPNRIRVSEILIQKECDIDAQTDDGTTRLHLAAFHGDKEMAEFLLENGANTSLLDKTKNSSLRLAMIRSNWYIAFCILKKQKGVYPIAVVLASIAISIAFFVFKHKRRS